MSVGNVQVPGDQEVLPRLVRQPPACAYRVEESVFLGLARRTRLAGVHVRRRERDWSRTGLNACLDPPSSLVELTRAQTDTRADRRGGSQHGDTGPALVVGSKRAPGTTDTRPWPRRAITATFAAVLRLGFGLGVSDTHGMKAMRREVVEPIVRRCRNGTDLFDTELVLRADRAGLRVAEVPVTVEERRPSRTPIARRVPRTLVGLLRLRVQLWRDPS